MKIKTEKVIELSEWDQLVEKTYGRPYSFQQQDGCKDRGLFRFTVPSDEVFDFENDSIVEKVNGPEQGVSFAAWLKRDPKQPLRDEPEHRNESWMIELWWHRNFYPDVSMIAEDLHTKGLLEAGEYIIEINW